MTNTFKVPKLTVDEPIEGEAVRPVKDIFADQIGKESDLQRDLRTLRREIDSGDLLAQAATTGPDGMRRSQKLVLTREALRKFDATVHPRPGTLLVPTPRDDISQHTMQGAIDMAVIAGLRMEGLYQWEIAERLGVSTRLVEKYLQNVRDLWLQSSVIDFNQRKAEEVAKVDYLERKSWETINRVNALAEQREGGMSELDFRRIKTAQDVIMWCIVQRCKVFGLEAPVRIDWRIEARKYGIDADEMYHALVQQFTEQIIDAQAVELPEIAAPEGEDDADDDAD